MRRGSRLTSLFTSVSSDAMEEARCASSAAVADFSSASSFAFAAAILAADSLSAAVFALLISAAASSRAERMMPSASVYARQE